MNYGTGFRLRDVRKMRGFTQKELGIAVGFSEKTADIRIAQYESGTRKPQKKILDALARALNVEPFMLVPPYWRTDYEVMHTLFSLNKRFNMTLQETDGHCYFRFEDYTMNKNLLEWKEKREKLINKEISSEEYYEWMYTYPREKEKSAKKQLNSIKKR